MSNSKHSSTQTSIDDHKSYLDDFCEKVVLSIMSNLLKGCKQHMSHTFVCRIGAVASNLVGFFSGIAIARSFAKHAKGTSKFLLYLTPITALTSICLELYTLLYDAGLMVGVMECLTEAANAIRTNISTIVTALTRETNTGLLVPNNPELNDVIELQNTFSDGGSSQISSNALSPTQYIGLATSILCFALVCGASLIGWKVSEINNFLRLRLNTFTTAKEMSAGIVETLEALGFKDVTGRVSIVKETEQVLELAHNLRKVKLADFIVDAAKFAQLTQIVDKIAIIQKKAINVEIKKTLTTHLAKLDKEYNHFFGIYTQVADLLSDTERQNCVGVLLEGDGGIGKSHFAKHLLKSLGERLGYGSEIYDLSRGSSKRFNKPYAFQSLGIFNEFGAQRADDLDYLEDINKILSSDPHGLESASENLKYQPCKLKIVVFTSNSERHDFTKKMTEGANIALMSRFIRVQIRDQKLSSDRNALNEHRTPNYSHLECQILRTETRQAPTSLSDCWNSQAAKLTAKQLEEHLVPILAMHEEEHIKRTQKYAHQSPEVVAALQIRIDQLHDVKEKAQPPVLDYGTTGTFKTFLKTSGSNKPVYPNASEPLVFHFAGEPGIGKTIAASTIANRLKHMYGLPSFECTPGHLPDTSEPCVYIFNDYPFENPDACSKYMTVLERAHAHSLVIITSNHPFITKSRPFSILDSVVKYYTYFRTGFVAKVDPILGDDDYWLPVFKAYPGLVRRVGLPYAHPACSYEPRNAQVYFRFTPMGLPVPSVEIEGRNIIDQVCHKYTELIRQTPTLVEMAGVSPLNDHDVTLHIEDYVSVKKSLETPIGIAGILKGNAAGKLTIDSDAVYKKVPLGAASDWVIPEMPDDADIKEMIKKYAYRLKTVAPRVTFQVVTPDCTYAFVRGILYISEPLTAHVKIINGIITVLSTPIPPSDFSKFYTAPLTFSAIDGQYTFLELETAKNFYELHKEDLPQYTEAIHILEGSSKFKHKFVSAISFVKSVVGWRLVGLLAALASLYAAYKVVKKFLTEPIKIALLNGGSGSTTFGSDSHEKYDNRTNAEIAKAREEAQIKAKKVNWRQGMRTKAENDAYYADDYFVKGEKRGAPITPNGDEPEHREVLQASINTALEVNNMRPFMNVVSQSPEPIRSYLLPEVMPNAVAPDLEHARCETVLTASIIKVKRNLFTFSGRYKCYGIFMRDRIGLVPCHALDVVDENNNFALWAKDIKTPAVRFKVKILAYTTVKDLAIIECPEAPLMRNITDLLPRGTSAGYTAMGCYVRPFETTEMCWGTIRYNPVKAAPLSMEEYFHPFDYVHFDQFTFGARSVYQIGDCGLPLFSVEGNVVQLAGIHIALSNNDEGWFSPLVFEELEHIPSNTIVKNAIMTTSTVEGFTNHVSIPDWNPVMENLTKDNPISNHKQVPVKGTFNSGFSITPKPDKIRVHYRGAPKLNFPLETLPAPTMPKMLTKEARELLPKLDNGKPSALLAQTLKYFSATPFTACNRNFEHAYWMEEEFFKIYFGTNNKLLRTHEVVNGILGSSLKRITLSSSAGPYMKYFHHVNFKDKLFKISQENPPVYSFDLSTEAGKQLYSDYKDILDCWSVGRPVAIVIKDNPKVEILPAEDVQIGKLRKFCELDLAPNLALRRYMGAVFDKMANTSTDSPWKISWNPYTMPHYIVNSERKEFDIICIDVKRMDKNLDTKFVEMLCKLVNSTFEDPCPLDFKAIAETMSQAIHIQGNIVYTQKGGNHSGSYLTTPLNTVSVHLCALYAFTCRFVEIYKRLPSLKDARQYMTSAGMGDDARYTFHPALKMTFEYLQAKFLECGLEIVENKNAEPGAELGDLCSRVFMHDEERNVIFGCLKKCSILKQIHWVKKSKRALFPYMAELAIFEAALWEKDFFDKVVADVHKLCNKLGIDPTIINYSSYYAYRDHLAQYIRGQENCPVVTSNQNDIFGSVLPDSPPQELYSKYIYEYHLNFPLNDKNIRELTSFDKATGKWTVTVHHQGFVGVGQGSVVASARGLAFKELCSQRLPAFLRTIT